MYQVNAFDNWKSEKKLEFRVLDKQNMTVTCNELGVDRETPNKLIFIGDPAKYMRRNTCKLIKK